MNQIIIKNVKTNVKSGLAYEDMVAIVRKMLAATGDSDCDKVRIYRYLGMKVYLYGVAVVLRGDKEVVAVPFIQIKDGVYEGTYFQTTPESSRKFSYLINFLHDTDKMKLAKTVKLNK